MEMWCAARHCAFESHPLRHRRRKSAKRTFLKEAFPLGRLLFLQYTLLSLRRFSLRNGRKFPVLFFFLAKRGGLQYNGKYMMALEGEVEECPEK